MFSKKKQKEIAQKDESTTSKYDPNKELDDTLNEEKDKKDKENSEKINKKNKYSKSSRDVIGGIFGDKDSRTRHSANSMTKTIIFSSLVVAGVAILPFKMYDYHEFVVNNTTPIGNVMQFKKTTNASMTLKEVYTDKNHDVTIVRLGYDNNTLLSTTSGKAYGLHLLIQNKNILPKDFKMSYGILGTDGDGYLFLKGKLPKQAYQIVIANRSNFHLTDEDVNDGENKNAVTDFATDSKAEKNAENEENQSVTSMFANVGMDEADDDGHMMNSKTSKENNNKNAPDIIDFRVNPYSKSTKVYDGSFLTKDGNINYSKVIEVMNVQPNIEANIKAKKEAQTRLKNYEKAKKEYQKRLEMNPDDVKTKDSLENIEEKINNQKETIIKADKQIEALKAFHFDKSSFGKMQDKFDVQTSK